MDNSWRSLRALRRQRLEEAKRGATEKSLMYMAWGPGTGLPKVCLKTLGSRSRLLSFEMRNETKGIQRLYEIVEFVYVCFQAISRWPSNDFRWLTGVLYCSSSPAMENFEVPDVESSQVPPCTNPITSVVCHQVLGTCCMTVPVRNRPVRRFKP